MSESIDLRDVTTYNDNADTPTIEEKSLSATSANFTINVSGTIYFALQVFTDSDHAVTVRIDEGERIRLANGESFSFEGDIKQSITLSCGYGGAEFSTFEKRVSIIEIYGDVDKAIANILSLQNSFIGGESK